MGALCKVCDAADWFDDAMSDVIRSSLRERPRFHRKQWEFARIFLALRHLGLLDRGRVGLSLGAGRERLLYALAPHVRRLFAADLYGEDSDWADARCIDVEAYLREGAPFEVDTSTLTGLRMDMRALEFGEGVVDFCYSSCAVEHIGDLDDVLRHLREVRRVLRDGGVYVFTTEFHFGDELIRHPHDYIFPAAALEDLVAASGLTPISAVDASVHPHAANKPLPANLEAFAFGHGSDLPPWLTHEPTHVQLMRGRHPFTSVLLALRKDATGPGALGLQFTGLRESSAVLASGVRELRDLLSRSRVGLSPHALGPSAAPGDAGGEPQAGQSADDTLFHTDYVWLGRGARSIAAEFHRAGDASRGSGVVELRVHRYATIAGAPVDCVLSEQLTVGEKGGRHTLALDASDDHCYAVVAKARGGDVRFERVDVAVSPGVAEVIPPRRRREEEATAASTG